MHIIGNGVDIIKNSRINNSLKIKGFLNRIFTEKEIQQGKKLKNKISFYAKRFAAKEAFSKAIGTGFSKGINFNEIIVLNMKSGKPKIELLGTTKNKVKKILNNKKFEVFLSLSDDKALAVATVVISI